MSDKGQILTAIGNAIQSITFATAINGAVNWRNQILNSSGVPNKLRLWSTVSAEEQPAAFLVTHLERDEYRGLGLVRRRLELGVWCYSRADNAPGAPDLDVMVKALEGAIITPDNFSTNCNTLGGLVYWCRIEGRLFKDPGDIDSQALLILPIVVEMP
jgi:hypothetical protein